MSIDSTSLIVIFLVAVGTYSLRVSGLLLSTSLTKQQSIKTFLEHLPATILISLIAPSIIKEGVAGIIALIFIALVMYKSKNIFLAMTTGILIVALYRNFFL